jgi:hypothetical protein
VGPPVALVLVFGVFYAQFGEVELVRRILGGIAPAAAGLMIATAGKMSAPLFRQCLSAARGREHDCGCRLDALGLGLGRARVRSAQHRDWHGGGADGGNRHPRDAGKFNSRSFRAWQSAVPTRCPSCIARR